MLYGNYCYIFIKNFPQKFSPCRMFFYQPQNLLNFWIIKILDCSATTCWPASTRAPSENLRISKSCKYFTRNKFRSIMHSHPPSRVSRYTALSYHFLFVLTELWTTTSSRPLGRKCYTVYRDCVRSNSWTIFLPVTVISPGCRVTWRAFRVSDSTRNARRRLTSRDKILLTCR